MGLAVFNIVFRKYCAEILGQSELFKAVPDSADSFAGYNAQLKAFFVKGFKHFPHSVKFFGKTVAAFVVQASVKL